MAPVLGVEGLMELLLMQPDENVLRSGQVGGRLALGQPRSYLVNGQTCCVHVLILSGGAPF